MKPVKAKQKNIYSNIQKSNTFKLSDILHLANTNKTRLETSLQNKMFT